ncbi:MAG: D-TA family PLP-dependent enzyme, partial [Bacteroidetes bacterium]
MLMEWYEVKAAEQLETPGLLVYPERIEANIEAAIALAGGPERLQPHVKTHKLPQVVAMHRARGIDRFKCATIAEAEMLARAGAREILLAHQPVGPRIGRLRALARAFPHPQQFATLADDVE